MFNRWPQAPWAPCGKSLPKNCALRVTSHLKCARHEYQYHHWNWELEEGPTIEDLGVSTTDHSTVTWLRGIWEEDEGDWEGEQADGGDSKRLGQLEDRVKAWLNSIG